MARRERDSRDVVEADHVGDQSFDRAIDQHDRNAASRKRLQQFLLHAERVHDHAFDAVRREELQIAAFHVDFVGRVADERHVAERMACRFDALQHFDRIRIGQVGEQHADQPVAATLQTARHLIRAIVEFRDRGFDPLAQFRRQNARLAVQVARDAGLAGAGFARDVGDRCAACGGGRRHRMLFFMHGLSPGFFDARCHAQRRKARRGALVGRSSGSGILAHALLLLLLVRRAQRSSTWRFTILLVSVPSSAPIRFSAALRFIA